MVTNSPCLLITSTSEEINAEWSHDSANLHFHDYRIDDYGKEVVSLEANYEHRAFINNLAWEETHRQWTGERWQIDFEPLDDIVEELVGHGFPVSIAVAELEIYRRDYGGEFLESCLPEAPPPDDSMEPASEGQAELDDFDA